MKPLMYDLEVIRFLKLHIKNVQSDFNSASINTDFFYYHNHTCPRCLSPFKVVNNTVRKVGTVSVFYYNELDTLIFYACCKECCKEIAVQSAFGSKSFESDKKLASEEYICEKLGL